MAQAGNMQAFQLQQQLLELYKLLESLHSIGKESPQLLIHLSEIVQPELPPDTRIPTIGKMFEELPPMFQGASNPQQLMNIAQQIRDPPPGAVHLRLLLSFQEMSMLLHQMTYLQILQFTNHLIPPAPLDFQRAFLARLQEIFQSRDKETLLNHHNMLANTPLHLEMQQLIELERGLPLELLYVFGELLKLPTEELFSLQFWFAALAPHRLSYLVRLLLLEPNILIELKKRLTAEMPTPHYALPAGGVAPHAVLPGMAHSLVAETPPISVSLTGSQTGIPTLPRPPHPLMDPNVFRLKIARQPPSKTVYQRILKPFPAVAMVSGSDPQSNLFVEVALIRSDSELELPMALEGNKIVRISTGIFATFKKLKILSTSQMQGTLFRLRFLLKRYVGTVFEVIQGATVISDPIEVFSHTLYLNTNRADMPSPPVLNECLPAGGPSMGGTRIVLLGSNFVHSPDLKVRVGDMELIPTFHESGTLIIQMPPHPPGVVQIRVANDGRHFCESRVMFTFQG